LNLLIITHKETWRKKTGIYTTGGFPFQINALSHLFDSTTLICTNRRKESPSNLSHIRGKNCSIRPLQEPPCKGILRHLLYSFWLLIYSSILWKSIKSADVIHAMIPGDIGLTGLLMTLIARKPLFIRHCGTWGNTTTMADKFIHWLIPEIANRKTIVMATGWGVNNPEPSNPNIKWIFSTSMNADEWGKIPTTTPWNQGDPLRLIYVGRLSKGKNIASIIHAIPLIKKSVPIKIDIVGDGEEMTHLQELVNAKSLDEIVTFHGNCNHEDVLKILSNNHIFLFPTNTKEGFPKALLEAMACGLPSIATRVSVIPSLIENKCGLVLDETDPHSIANAVIKMASDPISMNEMGKKARKISQKYTLENWGNLISRRLEKEWGPLKIN